MDFPMELLEVFIKVWKNWYKWNFTLRKGWSKEKGKTGRIVVSPKLEIVIKIRPSVRWIWRGLITNFKERDIDRDRGIE